MHDVLLLRASYETATDRNFRREVPADVTVRVAHDTAVTVSDIDYEQYDGIIVSGSRAAVYDDEAWIADLKQLVRDANEEGIPTLGVCWGHQLLAAALGGTVEAGDVRELGYVTVDVTGAHPVFHGISDTFTAFQSHGDYVTALPPEAERLAENERGVQAFALEHAVGVQFHPEVDYRSANTLVGRYSDRTTVPEPVDVSVESWALAEESRDVLRNFVYNL